VSFTALTLHPFPNPSTAVQLASVAQTRQSTTRIPATDVDALASSWFDMSAVSATVVPKPSSDPIAGDRVEPCSV
jgi:hypothetical protein